MEYKSLLCLSAVRAHLGLEPDAALVEELLPVGPTSFPEIDLHHSIEGLRAVFPDGTRSVKYNLDAYICIRLYCPSALPTLSQSLSPLLHRLRPKALATFA